MNQNINQYRTHNCGALNKNHVNQTVKLSGWVYRKRDHGNILFIDLRDNFGLTQLVFSMHDKEMVDKAASIRYESVITVSGKVVARSKETRNTSIPTGEIEVLVDDYKIESMAEILPFSLNIDQELPEDLRLRYRFLDLRRHKLHQNILLRSKVINELRRLMITEGFTEFQTPILTASSPEGARDFVVPSRLHPGKFYALPQAPQQFKQLLMVAGFDRYFQIAPCFRDEDARADRSPGEFYQLDVEMSFVTQEDVFAVIERVMYKIFDQFGKYKIADELFPRITYSDAMLKYGCDKPDLRNPLVISDVTENFLNTDFTIFKNNISKGFVVRAIPAIQAASQPRSFFDKMIEFAKSEGAGGLAYIQLDENGTAKGPIAKFFDVKAIEKLKVATKISNNDAVFFCCEEVLKACKISGKVRNKIASELDLFEKDVYRFCWVVDFPFYELNEETKKIEFSHNPFSMPNGGLEILESATSTEELLKITAYQYDIVCNGIELSSGAIRNHKPEIMYKAFEIAGYSAEVVEEKFGGMLKAFKFGAPPHGGIAPGVDRIIMLLADEPNIREVIAFPFNQQAQDLLMNAPSNIELKQLAELHIKLDLPREEKKPKEN